MRGRPIETPQINPPNLVTEMSERKLHRGHTALLGVVQAGDDCTATLRNGTVAFDHHSQDFLVAWYEDLKGWNLIHAEDFMGKNSKLGEAVSLTDDGRDVLEQLQQA